MRRDTLEVKSLVKDKICKMRLSEKVSRNEGTYRKCHK